jgi:hypothetical protein
MDFSRWVIMRRHLSGLLLGLLLAYVASTRADPNAPCYFPGGDPALLYKPCDEFAFVTSCCPTGWTCFSNDLCIATDAEAVEGQNIPLGTTFRATCTNPIWSRTCAQFCLGMSYAESGPLGMVS